MTKACFGVLVAASLLLPAFAQNRASFPWWNSPITREIGLTPDQSQRIHSIVRAHRNRLLDARNNVLKAQGEMEDILNDTVVDPNHAKAAINQLTSAQAASSHALLEMSIELRSVLTLDQWRQLIRRWDEMQRRKPTDTQVPP